MILGDPIEQGSLFCKSAQKFKINSAHFGLIRYLTREIETNVNIVNLQHDTRGSDVSEFSPGSGLSRAKPVTVHSLAL
jgi:hypothetical protein